MENYLFGTWKVLLCCLLCSSFAESNTSSKEISTKSSHLSKQISNIQKKSEMPGLSVRVFENTKNIYEFHDGARAIGFKPKVTNQDLWHIGSCTKPMTAALFAQLVDEKRIQWDTKLSDLFKSRKVNPQTAQVTVEMLLSHRAGLQDVTEVKDGKLWPKLYAPGLDTKESRKILVDAILESPLKREADSAFEYSNASYVVLGAIVEELDKKSWEESIRDRVFSRLDMKSCGFGPAGRENLKSPTAPWGHELQNGKLKAVAPGILADNPSALGPAGTVHCSSDDIVKFYSSLMAGFLGHSGLASPMSIQKLLSESKQSGVTYATLGRYEREWANGTAFAMAGSNTMNYTLVAMAPKRSRVLMINTNSGTLSVQDGATKILKLLSEN